MSEFEKMMIDIFKDCDINTKIRYDKDERRLQYWIPKWHDRPGYWRYVDSSRFVDAFNYLIKMHRKHLRTSATA